MPASPVYYFTMAAQVQAPVQRLYNMNKPPELKKTPLLPSYHSPGVHDGAVAEYQGSGYGGDAFRGKVAGPAARP